MTKIRNFTQRSPLLFSVVFTIASYWLMIGISELLYFVPASFFGDVVSELVHMIWPVLLAVLLGYGYICTGKGFGKTFKAGWGYLAFYVFMAGTSIFLSAIKPDNQWESIGNIILGLLMMIGIGIREEFLFRGIVGNMLALKYVKNTKGLWLTAIVSSLLFGFVHMFNVLSGVALSGAFVQSLGAASIGLIVMSIYLRGGNIWFVALAHAVVDFAGLFESTFVVSEIDEVDQMSNLSAIGPFILIPVSVIVALILFRKSKRQEIFERFDVLRAKFGY